MSKAINKFKQNLASIHWPTRKELLKDTTICVVTSAILAILIALWTAGIEYVVNFVLSLF